MRYAKLWVAWNARPAAGDEPDSLLERAGRRVPGRTEVADMAGDWIKLHRKSRRSQVFAKAELWKLWCLCLMKANYQDTWVEVHGLAAPVLVKRGQFLTGRYALHREFYYPKPSAGDKAPSTLWRMLECLRGMGNVNIKTNSRFSLVTVVNYGRYQSGDSQNEQPDEQPVNSRRAAGEQPTRTVKKPKKPKKINRAGARFPEDLEFPEGFDTPEVRKAVDEWLAYKQGRGQSYKSPGRQMTKMLAGLDKDGNRMFPTPEVFVGAVNHSIANNYQGCFPSGGSSGRSSSNRGRGSTVRRDSPARVHQRPFK